MRATVILRGGRACGFLLLAVTAAQGQVQPNSITVPNEFRFSCDRYFASKGTTNAAVTVNFSPGHSGFYGSVDYATQDGTAVANRDYRPVSGTLNFTGSKYPVINVPLIATTAEPTTNCSIQLRLTQSANDPNANITRADAVLYINLPPPPALAIAPGENGTVVVFWRDDGTEPVLEWTGAPVGADWSAIYNVPGDGNGLRFYTDVTNGASAFYRLRRVQ